MNINSNDIILLKQLNNNNNGRILIKNIKSFNSTQIKYRITKINYLLSLLKYPEIQLDNSEQLIYKKESIKYLILNFEGFIHSKEYRINTMNMLLLKQNYINKNEMQNFFKCSRSTVKNDFLELKFLLKKFNLSLKYIQKVGFVIDGNEKKVRDFFINYFILNYNFFKNSVILEKSKNLMNTILKGHNSSFETSKIIIILLTIQYYRINNNNYIDPLSITEWSNPEKKYENKHLYLNELIKPNSNLGFENFYFEFYLNNLIYNKIKSNNLKDFIFYNSLNIFIRNVGTLLNLDLTEDDKLRKGLSNHIKVLLFKKKNSIPVNKEDFESFKKDFYNLYESVFKESKIFRNNFKVSFEEGDLLYISYHFLSAINRCNNKKIKRVLIICNKGIGAAKILEEKLKTKFFVKIVDNLSFYEYQMYRIENVDIIIHTLDDFECDIKNLKVSPFISKTDEIKIENLECLKK